MDKNKINDFIINVMHNERVWLFENPEVISYKFIGSEYVYQDYISCSSNSSSDVQEIFDLYQSNTKYSRGGL